MGCVLQPGSWSRVNQNVFLIFKKEILNVFLQSSALSGAGRASLEPHPPKATHCSCGLLRTLYCQPLGHMGGDSSRWQSPSPGVSWQRRQGEGADSARLLEDAAHLLQHTAQPPVLGRPAGQGELQGAGRSPLTSGRKLAGHGAAALGPRTRPALCRQGQAEASPQRRPPGPGALGFSVLLLWRLDGPRARLCTPSPAVLGHAGVPGRVHTHLELVEVAVLRAPGLLEPHEVRGSLVEVRQQHLWGGRTPGSLPPRSPSGGPQRRADSPAGGHP